MKKNNINNQIFKLKLLVIIAFLNGSMVISQNNHYDYFKSVYSSKEMNIKGKVKKISEMRTSIDRDGNLDIDEKKFKIIYVFDELGNISKTHSYENYFGNDERDNKTVKDFYYEDNRVSKTFRPRSFFGDAYEYFTYTNSKTIIKDEEGNISEIRNISNGKVIEIIIRPVSDTKYSHRYLLEYNSKNQLIKRTYKDDSEESWKYTNYSEFEYNSNGDISLSKQYDNENKLNWIYEYNYKYDKNNNWIECKYHMYPPGSSKKNKSYTLFTRDIEYYLDDNSKNDLKKILEDNPDIDSDNSDYDFVFDETIIMSQEKSVGILKSSDGEVYIGEMRGGSGLIVSKVGLGTTYFANGEIYSGTYKNDKQHGIGIYIDKKNNVLRSYWNNGEATSETINPYAIITEVDQSKRGCLSGNCETGFGIYIFSDKWDGDVYIGNWYNGVKDGAGTYYYKSGDVYCGEFKNNEITGRGTYYYNDGSVFIGNFVSSQKNGEGIYLDTKNILKRGTWVKNVYQVNKK